MIGDIVGQVLAGIGGLTVGLLLVTWAIAMYKTLSSWTRYKQAERAAKREDERRINGTANDFDPLARWALGGQKRAPGAVMPPVISPPASTRPRKPYTRESGPQ